MSVYAKIVGGETKYYYMMDEQAQKQDFANFKWLKMAFDLDEAREVYSLYQDVFDAADQAKGGQDQALGL